MSDQAVLREYLVSLGFRVDAAARAKFTQGLGKLDKTAGTLGKTILGVSAAATTMATVFAREMEKMYYASKRADSTVGNMQALEFGAGQIGLSGDKMRASLEGMARALRSNPGLTGLLNQLGVRVEGRDKADVMTDLVAQLKRMPSYVAEQYAGLFGIDPDTLFMLQQGLDKLKEAQSLRKKLAAESGLDLEKAAEAGVRFSNSLREVWERIGLIGGRISSEMLPSMQRFADAVNNTLDSMNKWLGRHKTVGDTALSPFKEEASRRQGAPTSWWDWITTHRTEPRKPGDPKGFAPSGETKKTPTELFGKLEKDYALPDGMLGRMWKKESGEGQHMVSPKGALGHFQHMPATGAQYGVRDPYDLEQSATGAAKFLADLSKKYNGDPQMMAAAYNWGPGNLDRHGLGRAPNETRDYVNSVAPTIQQTNHFSIVGGSDPAQTAARVMEQQKIVNSDLVRNFTPRIQ